MLLDYYENDTPTNVYGSAAATYFTLKATNNVAGGGKYLDIYKGQDASFGAADIALPVYTIAVGTSITNPLALRLAATADNDNSYGVNHFYICNLANPDNAPNWVSADILLQKMALIARQEMYPRHDVIIRDRLANGFALDMTNLGTQGSVSRWYYDGLLNPAAPQLDTSLFPSALEVSGAEIKARVGDLYDEATAKELAAKLPADSRDIRYYYKAAVKFPITIDMETITKGSWVSTNAEADYVWSGGGKSPDYISPQIYFPKEPSPEPGDSGDPGIIVNPPETPPAEPGTPPAEPTTPGEPGAPAPETPYTPGGNDATVPPLPSSPGNTLEAGDNGVFIEISPEGVPLGEWHWEEPILEWVFDEYPPLAGLNPHTGLLPTLTLTAAILTLAALALARRRRKTTFFN
jgi:hypothetical protein